MWIIFGYLKLDQPSNLKHSNHWASQLPLLNDLQLDKLGIWGHHGQGIRSGCMVSELSSLAGFDFQICSTCPSSLISNQSFIFSQAIRTEFPGPLTSSLKSFRPEVAEVLIQQPETRRCQRQLHSKTTEKYVFGNQFSQGTAVSLGFKSKCKHMHLWYRMQSGKMVEENSPRMQNDRNESWISQVVLCESRNCFMQLDFISVASHCNTTVEETTNKVNPLQDVPVSPLLHSIFEINMWHIPSWLSPVVHPFQMRCGGEHGPLHACGDVQKILAGVMNNHQYWINTNQNQTIWRHMIPVMGLLMSSIPTCWICDSQKLALITLMALPGARANQDSAKCGGSDLHRSPDRIVLDKTQDSGNSWHTRVTRSPASQP